MPQSGLGKKPNGCKKFEKFIPHYIDHLHELLHNDEYAEDEVYAEGEEEGNDVDACPMSNSSRKRSSNTKDTTSSPSKKGKNQFLNIFKGLIDTMQAGSFEDTNTMRDYEIQQSLMLARECGATDESEEIFMATELFATRYNRTIFANIKTNEARLKWLQIKCARNK
uniref:Myb/SANT-like domain-containing protein n=1 Tax=Setaria viridis TaxID=4556 RepID=A0A4U6VLJ5_SETVI|nr:hypothetical protein SEVIR_3G327700v2 [Setaria viridis]